MIGNIGLHAADDAVAAALAMRPVPHEAEVVVLHDLVTDRAVDDRRRRRTAGTPAACRERSRPCTTSWPGDERDVGRSR